MKSLLFCALFGALAFFLVAFVEMDVNPNHWADEARVLLACIWGAIIFLGALSTTVPDEG